MKPKYTNSIILCSTFFFCISSFIIENNIFFLSGGLALGVFWGLCLFSKNCSPENMNLFDIGSASYLIFSYGGLLYALSNINLPEIIEIFTIFGYKFDEIDVSYACIYSNLFCIAFCFIGKRIGHLRYLIRDSIKVIRRRLLLERKSILIFTILIITIKSYLIATGKINFSFQIDFDKVVSYGGIDDAIIYFIKSSSASSIFLISMLMFSKSFRNIFLIPLLIPELIYGFAQGRRPLIGYFLIFLLGYLVSNRLNKHVRPTKNRKEKSYFNKKNILTLGMITIVLFTSMSALNNLRFSIKSDSNSSKVGIIDGLLSNTNNGTSRISNEELNKTIADNLVIRNAFTIAYISHTVHGVLLYNNFSTGSIIVGEIIQIIPSAIGLIDKSTNLQGEAIISNLTNVPIQDGANTLVVYSLADFSIFGIALYPLLFLAVNLIYFSISKKMNPNSALIASINLSCILFYYFSMSETGLCEFLLIERDLLMINFIYVFIALLLKTNKKSQVNI